MSFEGRTKWCRKGGHMGSKTYKNRIQHIPLVYRFCAFGAGLKWDNLSNLYKQFCRPSLDTLFLCFVIVVSDEQIVGSVPCLSPNRKKHQRKEITNFRDTCCWWGSYLWGTKRLNSRVSRMMFVCFNIRNINWTVNRSIDCQYKNWIWFGYIYIYIFVSGSASKNDQHNSMYRFKYIYTLYIYLYVLI